jgi:hypothetical protein
MPAEVLDQFGVEETTTVNGNYWPFDQVNDSAIVDMLAKFRVSAIKRDDLRFF